MKMEHTYIQKPRPARGVQFEHTTQNQISIIITYRAHCVQGAFGPCTRAGPCTCAEPEVITAANWATTAYTTNMRYQPSYDVVMQKKHSKIDGVGYVMASKVVSVR
jgi:hypothetical protein